ncbi:MAG: methyltransferase [Bacilli bacterium]|nr:methyltransferase [Bacilli bacterium]
MNKNKILIELEIPLLEKKYDLFIPINRKIGTIKRLIENSLSELTETDYKPNEDSNLYSKDTGEIYDVNKTVRDTDLKNGSRVILI